MSWQNLVRNRALTHVNESKRGSTDIRQPLSCVWQQDNFILSIRSCVENSSEFRVAHRVLKDRKPINPVASKREVTALSRDILNYLAENPRAEDTVEGITRWWLLHRNILRALALVEAALEKLLKQKAIKKYVGPDGRTYYRVSSQK